MSLSTRIQQNRCAFVEVHGDGSVSACEQPRTLDAEVCSGHLAQLWRNQLDRLENGTYVARRVFPLRVDWGKAA